MTRRIAAIAVVLLAAVLPVVLIGRMETALTVSAVAVCLVLWLSEMTPPFVPTLILWAVIPLLPGHDGARYTLGQVLGWAADPVLALFFGGFVMGAAAGKQGLDRLIARRAFAWAGGSFDGLLLEIILLTAFLSMWISNIAAAALMFACLRPSLKLFGEGSPARRMLIVGVALGADLGGIATPIGTGPNAIAIAAVSGIHRVTFIEWMTFAVPLSFGMLAAGFLLLRLMAGKVGAGWNGAAESAAEALADIGSSEGDGRGRKLFLAVMAAAAGLWLTEPLHGIGAGVVALAAAAVIFLGGLLKKEDLASIDWSTLLLIAGGITLGRLLEASRIISDAVGSVEFERLHPTLVLFILCLVSATLAALMSNTATSVLLVPLAMAIIPQPSTAVIVAIAASFGIPFVISTPPNAMAYGEGGLKTTDLLVPGIIIMIAGCLLISLTGTRILNLAGIP